MGIGLPKAENAIDLGYLKGVEQLTPEEKLILEVAQRDGDDVLEFSDFTAENSERLKDMPAIWACRSSLFLSAKEVLIRKMAERSMPDVPAELREELSKKMYKVMTHSEMPQICELAKKVNELLKGDVLKKLSPEDKQASMRVLMQLEDAVNFNEGLGEDKITDSLSSDMRLVFDAICRGEIRVRFDKTATQGDAMFSVVGELDGKVTGYIVVNEQEEKQGLMIHEAMHAKQYLEHDDRPSWRREVDAYTTAACWDGVNIGYDAMIIKYEAENLESTRKIAKIKVTEDPASMEYMLKSVELKLFEKRGPLDRALAAAKIAKMIKEKAPQQNIDEQMKVFERAEKLDRVGLAWRVVKRVYLESVWSASETKSRNDDKIASKEIGEVIQDMKDEKRKDPTGWMNENMLPIMRALQVFLKGDGKKATDVILKHIERAAK